MENRNIPWLNKKDFDKALGQFSLQVGEVLSVFNLYGMGAYIAGAVEEIKELAVDFSLRTRGVDHPIQLKTRRNARR